jgi:hypothetical protein
MAAVIEFARTPGDVIAESSTGRLQAQLVSEAGANIDSSAVVSLVGTLQNHLGSVVNSRNQLTILNANGGTLSSTGLLTLILTPADTVAVEAGPEYQQRFFTIKGVHSTDKTLACEIRFFIRKLHGHP